MSRFMITFLASCWCIGTPRIMAQPAPTDSAQLLAVAANGYRANLESFEYMTCKYTVTWGFSKTLDDALAGRMEPGSQMAKAVFYKNGRIIRFRIEEDAASKATLDKPLNPEKMAEFPGLKTGPFVPFKTTDYLLSESHGLLFDPRGRTANIYDADTEKWKTVDGYFLLSMLQVNTKYDFGLLADQAARGEIRSKPEPARSEGEFKTTFHFSQDPTVTFTVDLTRGFLPTRMERKYKQGADGTSYVVAPQIRDCSKGRWFPERIVTFMKQFPTQSPCLIKDFKVTELDVDNRPPKEAFTLDLPAGTKILQFDDSFKWFATRQAEKIGPDDLKRIHNLTEKVPLVPQTDTTIVLPRNYTWVWYAVACGVLVIGYLGWRRVVSRRRQNVPT